MSLWVDKYRPKTLEKLDYHRDQAAQLKKLVEAGDFPHLLVFGASGAGKKTRIVCLLRELYGAGVERLKLEHQSFTTPSNKKIELVTLASNYHIEVNASDAGIYDRVVVQELIKTVAQSRQLDSGQQRDFKVIVLNEVDRLSIDAQHGLRRTMEKYMASCRLILCCESTSKVIGAIRSRCLPIRIAAPTKEDIMTVLNNVARHESLSLPAQLCDRVAEQSGRNLRKALLMLEACRSQKYPFSGDQVIPECDWQVYLRRTGQLIVEDQSRAKILEIRGRLFELLTHCIPPEMILRGLLEELILNCDGQLKAQVTQMAAAYEHRLHLGTKAIYHLEAFVVKFMAIYKRFLEEGILGNMDFF